MKRKLLAPWVLCAIAPLATAQDRFRATLDGDAEVPPVPTRAGGWSTFQLNPDQTLGYLVDVQGLAGLAAHIHAGEPGSGGTIVFTLEGGANLYRGTTAALRDDQVAALRAGSWYVDVHTAAHPDGEVRGQINPRPILFGAHLIGAQVVPPVTTSALGDATFTAGADGRLTYEVTTTGLSGTSAEIRTGALGENGPTLFTLSGGPTEWSGTTAAMSADDFTSLQELGLYVVVATAANPGGEVRGQIVRSMAMYGTRSAGSAGEPSFFGLGAPTPGGTITVKINSGLPGGGGLILGSLQAGAVQSSGCGYYLAAPSFSLAVTLDGAGTFKASLVMPDLPSFDLFLQFFGLDSSAPNGAFYASNALHLPFTSL